MTAKTRRLETKCLSWQQDTWTALITWFTPPQFDHELINILVFFLNLPWLVVRHFNSLPRCSRINDLGRSDYSPENNAAIQGHFTANLEMKLALNIALLWSQSERYYSKHETERGLQGLPILYKTPANSHSTQKFPESSNPDYLLCNRNLNFASQEIKQIVLLSFTEWAECVMCEMLERSVTDSRIWIDLANTSFWNMRASELWGVGTKNLNDLLQ